MAKTARRKRYSPTAPSFKNQRGFNRAVRRRANSEVQPLLQDINLQREREASAHANRAAEQSRWYGYEDQALRAGADRTAQSLQALMGSVQGMSGGGADALNAALRQQSESQAADARNMGSSALGTDPAIAQALAARRGAGDMSLAGNLATSITSANNLVGVGGIAGREASEQEGRRYRGITDTLSDQESDIRGRIPGLREQARASISQEELGKAGQRFQQNLASQEFGLSKKQFGLQKRGQKFQENLAEEQFGEEKNQNKRAQKNQNRQFGMDQQTIDIQKMQFAQDITDAATEEDKVMAEQRAKSFNDGVEALNSFMEPTKSELDKKGRPNKLYHRSYADALDLLTMQLGIPMGMAYKILRTSDFQNQGSPSWRRESEDRIDARKKARKNKKGAGGYNKGSGRPD